MRWGGGLGLILPLVLVCQLLTASPVPAQSLKTVIVPEPPNLNKFVRNRFAGIQLGKALFWDMQVGSDGMTACGSCHFHAGADNRNRAQLNPGTLGGDVTFQTGGPNAALARGKFPFLKFKSAHDPSQGIVRDWNDICGSQGVVLKQFVDIVPGSPVDLGVDVFDPVFRYKGHNMRRVEPRNTPSVINAVYNFSSFWDGRANNVFNGANPFGAADPDPKIVVNIPAQGGLVPTLIRMRDASLSSQALGPPLSDFEMSWTGRTWPKIGKKMLSLVPLGQQLVHPQDSALGLLSNSTLVSGVPTNVPGLNVSYAELIKETFWPKYWNNTGQIVTFDANGLPTVQPNPGTPLTTDQYTQMEANFSLFFGLSVWLYESTLIADNTPFDRYQEGFLNAMTSQQVSGMLTFQGIAGCTACHIGPELTGASVANTLANPNPPPPGTPILPPNPKLNPLGAIEEMPFTVGSALYDVDFLNLGLVRTADDPGRAGNVPFINPLTGVEYPLSFSSLGLLKRDGLLTTAMAKYSPSLPKGFRPTDTTPTPDRVVKAGAMKVPSLRNIELTGPYFHNGSMTTLMQVLDFYARGGNFPDVDINELPAEMAPIGFLRGNNSRQSDVIAFLLALTDPRVRNEGAPFDHPQIFVPHGYDPVTNVEITQEVPAVGAGGRIESGLQALAPFLDVNHFSASGN